MPSIDTTDIDEAASALGYSFPDLRLRSAATRPDFRLQHRRIDLGPLTYTRLTVSGDITTDGRYPDHVAIGRRRRGSVLIEYDGKAIDTGRPYVRPTGSSVARFVDSDVELLIVDRAAFEAAASRYLEGTGRRLLRPTVDLSSPVSVTASRLWRSVEEVIVAALTEPTTSSPGAARLLDLAVFGLLSAFPLTAEGVAANGTKYLPRALARATQYLDEHLEEPVTVLMVAEAARMSVRGVQSAFRRDLEMTPMQYHRQARLDAAHADLRRLDTGSSTVTEIAQRWGFHHPARFAGMYRARFGVNPAQTLRE